MEKRIENKSHKVAAALLCKAKNFRRQEAPADRKELIQFRDAINLWSREFGQWCSDSRGSEDCEITTDYGRALMREEKKLIAIRKKVSKTIRA